jgi:hypothetical protein
LEPGSFEARATLYRAARVSKRHRAQINEPYGRGRAWKPLFGRSSANQISRRAPSDAPREAQKGPEMARQNSQDLSLAIRTITTTTCDVVPRGAQIHRSPPPISRDALTSTTHAGV